jgi:N utilization substance protein A
MGTELKKLIEQLGKDTGINKGIIINALESALLTVAKKKIGNQKDIEARYNEETGDIEIYQFKNVVKDIKNPFVEIGLEEAKELDPDVEYGDSLGVKIELPDLGRISAQIAKHIIIQKVREAERDVIYNEFISRKGSLISGRVQRFEGRNIIVDLGRTEAILPVSEQIPKEVYHKGDIIKSYILDVHKKAKSCQIVLSRTHPNMIVKLFEAEVPEIAEGIIEIKGVAREPGERAKIAVYSNDDDIDPIGACVGMNGSRVQSVVQELRGEKIDIIPWDDDIGRYICNALSPVEILKVIVDESERSLEVVIPDEQLPIAIGKKGQNVKLAARLIGWKIDIVGKGEEETI